MAATIRLNVGTFTVRDGKWRVESGGRLAQALLEDLDRAGRDAYPQGRGPDLPGFDSLLAEAVVARFGGQVLSVDGTPPAPEGVVY
jgi:hypothetical protein